MACRAISTFWSEIRPHPGLKMAISWVACDDAVVMASPATSPAQYPAGSGVGVSVLLRQPHGFEGLLAPREDLAPGQLSVPEGPKRSDLEFEHSARPAGLKADKQVDHDLFASLEELLRLVDHLLEGLNQILEEPVCRLAATVGAGTW